MRWKPYMLRPVQSCRVKTWIWPGLNSSKRRNTSGIKGCVSSKRFDFARNTKMAKGRSLSFCWRGRLLSIVRKRSNLPESEMRRRSFPFLMPAQAMPGTVWTSWPGKSRRSRAGRHSSSRMRIQAWGISNSLASSSKATACSLLTVGKSSRKSANESPPSR